MGIGRRIKEAREKMGLTQRELANLIGVTGGAIANYENETSHPKENVMYALIDALEVDANFLFQDCVKPKQQPSLSSEAIALAKQYDTLTAQEKPRIQKAIDEAYFRSRLRERTFASNLATLREEKKLSQKELAAKIGASEDEIFAWERGDYGMSFPTDSEMTMLMMTLNQIPDVFLGTDFYRWLLTLKERAENDPASEE